MNIVYMSKVSLIFPDTEVLAEFIIHQQIKHVEIDSFAVMLSGELSAPQIEVAVIEFDAYQFHSTLYLDD